MVEKHTGTIRGQPQESPSLNVVPVFDDTTNGGLPAIESRVHSMAIRLACPWVTVVVASEPLTRHYPFAWLVADSWVCASHWPASSSQEPHDNAEDDESQRGERQDSKRPRNRDPTLQRLGEEPEADDEEAANTSDELVD